MELRKTALNAVHRAAKAKMVDFGGWDMPVDCCGLIAVHMAVRTAVGVFDVSHMGIFNCGDRVRWRDVEIHAAALRRVKILRGVGEI
jgi:glycine cleavage system aminomethyltransferase T